MGCTTLAEFPTTEYISGLQTVKTSFNHNPTVGMNTFVLTNPYLWDGQSNLIVEFCVDNAQTGTTSSIRYGSPGYFSMLYTNQSTTSGVCSNTLAVSRVNARPNMRFTFCAAVPPSYTYSWSPTTGLNNPNIANPVATINTNMSYTVTVSDGGPCSGNNYISVFVDSTNFIVATASPGTTVCPGEPVQLNTDIYGPQQIPVLPACGTNNTACSQVIQTSQVGNGTLSTATYGPFAGFYSDSKAQYLFRASELNTWGINSGTIRELAWNIITKNSTNAYSSFTISLGCTNASVLATAGGWLPVTQVWSGNHTSTVGWNNFVLTNPFDWDGVSNLVVQICFNKNNNGGTSSDNVQYTSAIGFNCSMYANSNTNGTNGCTIAPVSVTTARPNLRVRVCPPPPIPLTYSWSPAASVSNSTIANPTTNPTANTTYVVTVTGLKCVVRDTIDILMCMPPLSVELLKFSGFAAEDINILEWITKSEINNDYFLIEHSVNGKDFKPIGKVNGNGTGNTGFNYTFSDKNPVNGINYYSLRQFDFDGKESSSETIAINNNGKKNGIVLYPNPVKNEIIINLNNEWENQVQVEIFDLMGKNIYKRIFSGRTLTVSDIGFMAEGIYMVKITVLLNSRSEIKKVVKQK